MIICHSHKFIYVHPPKTAGTAVSLALGELCGPGDAQIGDWHGARYANSGPLRGIGKHATLSAVELLPLGVDLLDYRVVLSVRNPWDRLASFYHWAKVQPDNHPQIVIAKNNDFVGFLASRRIQRAFLGSPYRSYAAKPDFVVRAEKLDVDLRQFTQCLGRDGVNPKRINESDRQRDWRPYYSAKTAAIVAQICAQDIADYGYRFDHP